jgi:hypothetical protein
MIKLTGLLSLPVPAGGKSGMEPNKTTEKTLDIGKNFDSVIQPKG